MATTFPYGYAGSPAGMGTLLTWDQMMTKSTVYKLHPEVQRRLRALMEGAAAAGVPLGPGTGWRVQPNPPPPGFAKPGNSYHEGFPADGVSGNAMAIDMVPNVSWNWMQANCAAYGFRTFRTVNNEPWHIQPSEIPTGRNFATVAPPLQRFNLPGTPAPPTPGPAPAVDYPRPTLRVGSTGGEVVELINHLKFWSWYPAQYMSDVNDGKFGKRTETGVKNMQVALKVGVDGVYGPQTAGAFKGFLEVMAALAG